MILYLGTYPLSQSDLIFRKRGSTLKLILAKRKATVNYYNVEHGPHWAKEIRCHMGYRQNSAHSRLGTWREAIYAAWIVMEHRINQRRTIHNGIAQLKFYFIILIECIRHCPSFRERAAWRDFLGIWGIIYR